MYDEVTINQQVIIMNKGLLFALVATILAPNSALADENDICDTKLYKQMVGSIKQGVKRPNFRPSKALSKLMSEDEMLCPLQIERDFNGDNQNDWVGVIEQNGEISLSAYMSVKNGYQLIKIKQYPRVPNNLYFDTSSEKTLRNRAGFVAFLPNVKFAAVENIIDGNSIAYAWSGSTMQKLIDFKIVKKKKVRLD